jgi:phosphinothricin acetyltransferase
MTIRDADPERDAAACAGIYAPVVSETAISFEESPPDTEEMARRIRAAHVWLVAEEGGEVVGYAYATQHRARPAYRWAVDVSAYVDPRHHRHGIGRELYAATFERLRERGYRAACAGVSLPNEGSLDFHRAMGFREIGTYRRIGWKLGRWRDVTWLQLDLAPEAPDAPPEPIEGSPSPDR